VEELRLFTGIIQEIGKVRNIIKGSKSIRLAIEAPKLAPKIAIGDSICTNGVCLTVSKKEDNIFWADATPETVKRTNLYDLKQGNYVNLEPSLKLQDLIGGHLVSGHVDGIGIISKIFYEENAQYLIINVEPKILFYMVEKGSVAVDGISLTIANIDERSFTVSIIPHSLQNTTLKYKTIGSKVNIECDMIGRYVSKFIDNMKKNTKNNIIDEDFLKNNGFI
jgi:riboflavin synthase